MTLTNDLRIKVAHWESVFACHPAFNDPKLIAMVRDAAAEIERLRAALEKYADPNYNGFNGGPEHAANALRGDAEQRARPK